MRAGVLRHRVTITRMVETSDGHHGLDETAATVAARVPACVMPLSGRALERAQQIDPRTTHQVDLRHRTGLATGQAVTYHDPDDGDRTFEIVAPPIDLAEGRRTLRLLCKEQEA